MGKLTLFAACLAAVFAATSALECYGIGAGKLCTRTDSESVDTATCEKKPCPKETNACQRVTSLASTTLMGCVKADKMECKTSNLKVTTCNCNGDLCNGAMMGSASMTAIVLPLASFVAVFVH